MKPCGMPEGITKMRLTGLQLKRLIREMLQFDAFLDPIALGFLAMVNKWADFRNWATPHNIMYDLDITSRDEAHNQAKSLQDPGYIEIKHLGSNIYRYRLTPEGKSVLRNSAI